MDMNHYMDLFIEESREHLQAMNDGLLALEKSPSNTDTVNVLFRSAHTLKGMAATMGFQQIAHVTHEMENVMDAIREGHLTVTDKVMDALFACADQLGALLEQVIETGSDASAATEDIVSQLSALRTAAADRSGADVHGAIDANTVQRAAAGGLSVYRVRVTIDQESVMPAVRAFMVAKACESIGDLLYAEPPLDALSEGVWDGSFEFALATSQDGDSVRQVALQVSEVADVDVRLIEDGALEAAPALEAAAAEKPSQAERSARSGDSGETKRSVMSKSIRIDVERLDTLMNLFSEFVITRTRLEDISRGRNDSELAEVVQYLSRVGSSLQDVVMQMRMVPVETVFNRFPRMVRDLAKTLGKRVDLEILGADTELDRTLVEEIADPLVHTLRNALDHGLEPPEERVRAGKPETGKIVLHAYQAGNHVFIEIYDDGRGIDRRQVLKKAVERGLVEPDRVDGLTDSQVFDFLFQPGFSTAQTISDISGRGVGLDVVKSKIQALGGDVSVESELGRGTRFYIQLPLTVSILQAMLVKTGDETYAIPLSSISRIDELQERDVEILGEQAMMRYEAKMIPLVYLRRIFGVSGHERSDGRTRVVVLSKGQHHVGLVVDAFLGKQEVVLKSIGKFFTRPLFGISGATILGDGHVVVIVDPNALIR